jgi:hypothetical protein
MVAMGMNTTFSIVCKNDTRWPRVTGEDVENLAYKLRHSDKEVTLTWEERHYLASVISAYRHIVLGWNQKERNAKCKLLKEACEVEI